MRNRHDQDEGMFACEINIMAQKGTLRVLEMLPSMIEGGTVVRVDFISEDPPRVFGASAIVIEKGTTPSEFTDKLRQWADKIDEFLWRDK